MPTLKNLIFILFLSFLLTVPIKTAEEEAPIEEDEDGVVFQREDPNLHADVSDAAEQSDGLKNPPTWPAGFAAFSVPPLPEDPWVAYNREKNEVRVAVALSPGLVQIESILEFILISGVKTQEGFWSYERGYESIFVTRAKPESLFFSFLLAGFKPGDVPGDMGEGNENSAEMIQGKRLEAEAEAAKNPGTHVTITVEWRDLQGRMQTAPISRFMVDRETGKAPKDFDWIFTGSWLVEGTPERGRYLAAVDTRAICATFYDDTALLNTPEATANPYQTDAGFIISSGTLPPEFRRTREAIQGETRRLIFIPRVYPATLIFRESEKID